MKENFIEAYKALTDEDAYRLYYRTWFPEGKPRAVLLVIHGMAEHGGRYGNFAEYCRKRQIAIIVPDLRGHGKNVNAPHEAGHFADKNGWVLARHDILKLIEAARQAYPGLPLFVLGHSMGSLVARSILHSYPLKINGLILSGTSASQGLLGCVGILLARLQKMRKGPAAKAHLHEKLSFGQYNKAFRPNRTPFDWLSRDTSRVDDYIADPYCGASSSVQFYLEMLQNLRKLHSAPPAQTNTAIPLLVFSGGSDPVGDFGKGIHKVGRLYKKAGFRDVSIKLYPGGRHEMLNETNSHEAARDLVQWMDERM